MHWGAKTNHFHPPPTTSTRPKKKKNSSEAIRPWLFSFVHKYHLVGGIVRRHHANSARVRMARRILRTHNVSYIYIKYIHYISTCRKTNLDAKTSVRHRLRHCLRRQMTQPMPTAYHHGVAIALSTIKIGNQTYSCTAQHTNATGLPDSHHKSHQQSNMWLCNKDKIGIQSANIQRYTGIGHMPNARACRCTDAVRLAVRDSGPECCVHRQRCSLRNLWFFKLNREPDAPWRIYYYIRQEMEISVAVVCYCAGRTRMRLNVCNATHPICGLALLARSESGEKWTEHGMADPIGLSWLPCSWRNDSGHYCSVSASDTWSSRNGTRDRFNSIASRFLSPILCWRQS